MVFDGLPIVDEVTDEDREPDDPYEGKDPAAVELGRRGGLKGGRARAEKLTPARRSEIARKAAQARWGTSPASPLPPQPPG